MLSPTNEKRTSVSWGGHSPPGGVRRAGSFLRWLMLYTPLIKSTPRGDSDRNGRVASVTVPASLYRRKGYPSEPLSPERGVVIFIFSLGTVRHGGARRRGFLSLDRVLHASWQKMRGLLPLPGACLVLLLARGATGVSVSSINNYALNAT
jgi:hypothetical protein